MLIVQYRLTLLLFLCFFVMGGARGHWNGVVLLFILCTLTTINYEYCLSRGRPFISSEFSKTSLWHYGFRRICLEATAARFGAKYHSIISGKTSLVHDIWGGAVFVSLLLHLYFGCLLILDVWDRDYLNSLLVPINSPFERLLPYWDIGNYGPNNMIALLNKYGYGNRIPLFFHAVWVSAFAFLILAVSVLIQIRKYLKELYLHGVANSVNLENLKKARLKGSMASIVLLIFLSVVFRMATITMKFPEEAQRYTQIKSSWMAGYGYEEYLAIFEPILPHFIATTGGLFCCIVLISVFYPPINKRKNISWSMNKHG